MITVTGWGHTKKANVERIAPSKIEEIQEVISNSPPKSLIARGLGRSYGDAAQNNRASIIELSNFKKISLNIFEKTVTAEAGVSFDELLKYLIPKGYFLPVTPGTKHITVGGAIAADIHGKNHHIDGSFGNHIKSIVLIDGKGILKQLFPDQNNQSNSALEFWATVSGMGLTGIIIEATFSVIPIKSSLIKVDTFKYKSLENIMDTMIKNDEKYKYSVAWIDSLHPKGRGVITFGEHALVEDINTKTNKEKLEYSNKSIAKAPNIFPSGLLNVFTVRAFNEAWYRKYPNQKENQIISIGEYFYPLDGIDNWNNIYGKKGFIQYQFVVPDNSSEIIPESLSTLRELGAPSFLTVLKRFGFNNPGLLSFPSKGWTLAIDIPASLPNLTLTLNKLDEKISDAGGKIYLAKDSRMSPEIFRLCYPKLKEWQKIKNILDPDNKFSSDLSKRLAI